MSWQLYILVQSSVSNELQWASWAVLVHSTLISSSAFSTHLPPEDKSQQPFCTEPQVLRDQRS